MSSYKRRDEKFNAKLCLVADSLHLAYRLFRDRNGEPATLYHAHEGSKVLPLGKRLEAYQGTVYNPGKRTTGGKGFRAGFHVFPTLADLIKYSKDMDGSYAVVEVLVSGKIRPKPRSRSTVLLAEEMTIPAASWRERIPLAAYLGRD